MDGTVPVPLTNTLPLSPDGDTIWASDCIDDFQIATLIDLKLKFAASHSERPFILG